MPERLEEAARRLRPGLDARIGSLAEHLAYPAEGELPVCRGELRSAARAHLLPGVVSARITQKQERAEAEALLERYAEPLAALVPGFAWPERELEDVWRLMILNGAHDSVCGCSVDEVAHAVDARTAQARDTAEEIVESALGALAAQVDGEGVVSFNPSPFERDGVPGLGWRLDAARPEQQPVSLTAREGRILAGNPAPLAPTSPVTDRAGTRRVTSSRARNPPNATVTSSSATPGTFSPAAAGPRDPGRAGRAGADDRSLRPGRRRARRHVGGLGGAPARHADRR